METTILEMHRRKIKENLDAVKVILLTLANQNVISDKNHAALLVGLGEVEKFIPDMPVFIKHVMEHGEKHSFSGHMYMASAVSEQVTSLSLGNGKTIIIK